MSMIGRMGPWLTGAASDPYFAYRVVGLHCDGASGSTTFTDNSPSPKSFTAYGDAQVGLDAGMFGGAALLLDGTGDYIQAGSSSDYSFLADFTIEFFAKKSANGTGGYDTVCTTDPTNGVANGGWILELSASRGFLFASDKVGKCTYFINPNDSTRRHWALSRVGSTLYMHRDGVMVASATYAGSIAAGGNFGVGRNNTLTSYPFNGLLEEVLIYNGVAKYGSGNFSPPTSPFANA